MQQSTSPVYQQTLFIAAPAAQVWELLTNPADVSRYYLCPLQAIDLQRGGRITYGVDGQSFITGKVLEVEPQRKLVHSFRFSTQVQPSAENGDSRVTYQIVPMGAMCELKLTHDGFGLDGQTYASIADGWPSILSGLKTLAETGKPLPWPVATAPAGNV